MPTSGRRACDHARTLIVAGTATSPRRSSCPTSSTPDQDSALTLLEAGHLSNVEQPDAFTSAITEFLS
jgi:pimeloyl-ACP methyl ester carboxylesterase